jgi:hypothetical protein
MPKPPSLENRVRILEGRVTKLEHLPARIDAAFARFSKEIDAKLEKRFRDEGEMMDERFGEVYTRMDERFAEFGARMDQRFAKVDARFDGIDRDLKILREGMKILLERSARSGL